LPDNLIASQSALAAKSFLKNRKPGLFRLIGKLVIRVEGQRHYS